MMMDWTNTQGSRRPDRRPDEVSPDTIRATNPSAANSKTSQTRRRKPRQLISLAVAVTTHCDGCIVRTHRCRSQSRSDKEEIAEGSRLPLP